MKVTIEIEAHSDGHATDVLSAIVARAARNRLLNNEPITGEGRMEDKTRDAKFSVRVDRENRQATAPEPDVPSPGVRRAVALERLADTMALIEGHLRPVITAELPPRYTLAENGRDVIDHELEPGGPYRDNLTEMQAARYWQPMPNKTEIRHLIERAVRTVINDKPDIDMIVNEVLSALAERGIEKLRP